LPVTLPSRREGLARQELVLAIDQRGDMEIFVGIDAAGYLTGRRILVAHWLFFPVRVSGFTTPGARTRQQRDRRQALLGSQAPARQKPRHMASRAADRSEERHVRSIRVRVRPPQDTMRHQPH